MHHLKLYYLYSCLLPALISQPLPTQAATPAARTAAEQFAWQIGEEVLEMFHNVTFIDRNSGKEDREGRRTKMVRQRELRLWLRARSGIATPEDCINEEDRRNLREYPETVAGHRVLAMSRRDRRRLLRDIAAYNSQLQVHFPAALAAVFHVESMDSLPALVQKQLHLPLRVQARALPRERRHQTAAVFLPEFRLVVIDPDQAAADIRAFFDTLEHEFWHHLLPGLDDLDALANLWWEGFNEALAEIWSAEFHKRAHGMADLYSDSVEYPVQSAFAALFLGAQRKLTLAYLTGDIQEAEFLERLAKAGQPEAALAKAYQHRLEMPSDRRQRVEKLLQQRGWREKDGGPISIGHLIEDHKLTPAKLQRQFIDNREFLMDSILALSMIMIQDLQEDFSPRQWRRRLDLPTSLDQNLQRVFNQANTNE